MATQSERIGRAPAISSGDAQADPRQSRIEELAPWFHNLHLPGGLQTAPGHWLGDFPAFKWRAIEPYIPQRLDGWTVLDIGCNAGYYSIELAQRGAEVLAIDVDPHYLRQARWAARQFEVADRIEFREMQVYDLVRLPDAFDMIWFMGVFYHLRYPLLALDIVAQKVRRSLVFQTLTMPGDDVCTAAAGDDIQDRHAFLDPGWPRMAFIEGAYVNDPTNWWAPNHAAVEAMLRSSGMRVTARPAHEVYLCEPYRDAAAVTRGWAMPEFHAVTQHGWRDGEGG